MMLQQPSKGVLSAKRLQEKADTLETNLFKFISKQNDPIQLQVTINRTLYPDSVICKALLQLTPRFDINPREFFVELRDLLKAKDLSQDKQGEFEIILQNSNETLYDDLSMISRSFGATASKTELTIDVKGIPDVKSIHGKISKSFFNHKQSPGKLSKDGVINFKEINKFPIVNTGDKLFFITHEKQGKQGVGFDGKMIPVEKAQPFIIDIGTRVKKIDVIDETGKSEGYFLQADTTGVVILDRNERGVINGIDISEKIDVRRLDYSTGNVGSHYSCPIQMKIGIICNGFKIRVNGRVEASIVDGGEITTDGEAEIAKMHSGSSVTALKDIRIDSVTHSKIISKTGSVTINRELIDSRIFSPKLVFEKNKGLITNNRITAENIVMTGLFFSGENIIHFGNTLFTEKESLITSQNTIREAGLALLDTQRQLMEKLQLELKRLTKLTIADHELANHIKPLIIATKTMDYEVIFEEIGLIQKRNNTKTVSNVKNIFIALEKIPKAIKGHEQDESKINEELYEINQKAVTMQLSLAGFLKRASTIKIFCGVQDDKKILQPDLVIESDNTEFKQIKVLGTYSTDKGFEFTQ